MPAVKMPQKVAEPGSPDEPLRCDCGHTFSRSDLDMQVKVRKFTWGGTLEDLEQVAWEVVSDYASIRSECPHCSCCSEEDSEINPDSSEDEEQWMCTTCLTIHDTEEEAVDCCG